MAYEMLISWCEVFLQGKSFSTFEGSKVAMALLFPMERLFEAYVAQKVKQQLRGWLVRAQKSFRCLFDDPSKVHLRPDIICEHDDKLEAVAQYLLAHNTMTRTQFNACMQGEDIPEAESESIFDRVSELEKKEQMKHDASPADEADPQDSDTI